MTRRWVAMGAALVVGCGGAPDPGERSAGIQGGVQTSLPAGVKFSVDTTDLAGKVQKGSFICSGMRFDVGKIVTARHCVEDAVGASITFIMAKNQANALAAPVAATGVAMHATRDLAVLFYDEPKGVAANVDAVILREPAAQQFKRTGKATGRRKNGADGAANEYLESAEVEYKLPGETVRAIPADDIASDPVLDGGDSGGAFHGVFLNPQKQTVFRPIAANKASYFDCVANAAGKPSSAPIDFVDNLMQLQPAAGPAFKMKRTMSSYQAYDTKWIAGAASAAFPAKSPVKTMYGADTVKGCLLSADSTAGNFVCTNNVKHLGAATTCTMTKDKTPGRAITRPTVDRCNEADCGDNKVRIVTDCVKECEKVAKAEGKTLVSADCGYPTETVKCPKNAPGDADSTPAQCFCKFAACGGGLQQGAPHPRRLIATTDAFVVITDDGGGGTFDLGAPPDLAAPVDFAIAWPDLSIAPDLATAPDAAADLTCDASGDGADGALVDGAFVDGALADGAIADGAIADGAIADSGGGPFDAAVDASGDLACIDDGEIVWVDHDIYKDGSQVDYDVLAWDDEQLFLDFPDYLLSSPPGDYPPE